jgi:2',3'-cyclic-nucleotide 2'-phosphodiesterase
VRILLIGDIVGKPGRQIIVRALPGLIAREGLDFVIGNGENAAGGSGITPSIYQELIAAGVDVITLGDHIYRRSEIESILRNKPNIVKPANFPPEAPGHDVAVVTAKNGVRVAVLSLLGRVFMRPVDCPFKAADRVLAALEPDVLVRIVDFHAEATSDKQLLGRYLDGRVSAVLGTHTHVPTADEQIFPGGTAFQCDVGMTGPYESILGRQIARVMETTLTFNPTHFEVATGDVRLSGSIVDIDPAAGRATAIRRLMLRAAEAETLFNPEPAATAPSEPTAKANSPRPHVAVGSDPPSPLSPG